MEPLMRQNTLAEAVERICSGEPQDATLAEFIDSFLMAPDARARYASIEAEPGLSGNARLDALVGAIAEYLAKQYRLGAVPVWSAQSSRRLEEPWFTTTSADPAMREYLSFASPAEFRWRNIFTEERPLRRARSHLPFVGKSSISSAPQ
jgi:hypothetical protein